MKLCLSLAKALCCTGHWDRKGFRLSSGFLLFLIWRWNCECGVPLRLAVRSFSSAKARVIQDGLHWGHKGLLAVMPAQVQGEGEIENGRGWRSATTLELCLQISEQPSLLPTWQSPLLTAHTGTKFDGNSDWWKFCCWAEERRTGKSLLFILNVWTRCTYQKKKKKPKRLLFITVLLQLFVL